MRIVGSFSFPCAGMARLALLLAIPAATMFGQAPAASSNAAKPADQPAAEQCPLLDSSGMQLNETLRVKVSGVVDSRHLKPGKELWFDVATGEAYPGCTLNEGAPVYAHVITSISTKKPDSAELSLAFDHADCEGHSKQPVRMILLGVQVPDNEKRSMHDAVPTEVAGGSRDISTTVAGTTGWDQNLNPGGQPGTIKPGVVVGMPHVTLDPQGGPACSAKLTSTNSRIQIGPGAILYLALVKVEQKQK